MEGLITGVLAASLARQRQRINARFAEIQVSGKPVEAADLANVLRESIAPTVDTLTNQPADVVDSVVWALVDGALQLLSKDLLGEKSRVPQLERAWRTLFPQIAPLIVADPVTVVGAISNAIITLDSVQGVRLDDWIAMQQKLARRAGTVESFLRCGQVTAWVCGMAHYRESALDVARKLPPELLAIVFGLAQPPADIDSFFAKLGSNRWLTPAEAVAGTEPQPLRLVARVGGFRGFGGLFMRPPIVDVTGGRLVVSDGAGAWLLIADVFGSTFHKITDPHTEKSGGDFRLEKDGQVTRGASSRNFPFLRDPASSASTASEMAVTTARSHAVYVIS